MTKIGGPRARIPLPTARQVDLGKAAHKSAKAQKSQSTAATQAVQDTVATQAAQAAELQKIEAFIEAVQADEEGRARPPEFANMSQAEQYDYLMHLCIQQAAGDETAWKNKDGEVNLIGIRNFAEGRLFKSDLNIYCDSLLMARLVEGKKRVRAVRANLAAKLSDSAQNLGCGFYADDGDFVALTELATGFYREAFVRVRAADDKTLLQQKGLLALQAPSQKSAKNHLDAVEQAQTRQAQSGPMLIGPRWQVQFLPGSKGHRDDVARPACQLLHPDDWNDFASLLQLLPKEHDSGMAGFSYLLVDGKNLPGLGVELMPLSRKQINPRLVFQQSPDLQSQEVEVFEASMTERKADETRLKSAPREPDESAQSISLGVLSRFVEGV